MKVEDMAGLMGEIMASHSHEIIVIKSGDTVPEIIRKKPSIIGRREFTFTEGDESGTDFTFIHISDNGSAFNIETVSPAMEKDKLKEIINTAIDEFYERRC